MRYITPIAHPSFILQGNHHLEPAQVAYLRRLNADPHPELVDISKPPPGCNPDPTVAQLRAFTLATLRSAWGLCLDIENAGPYLVCVGAMALGPPPTFQLGPGVCFRFRGQGGRLWWPTFDEHLTAVALLDTLLAAPRLAKVGHFSTQHDLPFLVDLGFEIEGPLVDTAALLHAVYSEFPKSLQFTATLFCGAPRWKDIPDEKEALQKEAPE